jgi:NADPH:quinone reductase
MTQTNVQIQLASRPVGTPTADNFRFVEAQMPQVNEGQMLLRTLYISVDPYMRGRMSDAKSYVAPFEVDKMLKGGVISQVVTSNVPAFEVGDIVVGELGWQKYTVSDGTGLHKVQTGTAPITTALGLLGMPGLTAYFGLLDIGQPQPGETVVVSGAAGAVGTIVGQIAKIQGCRVVGIAGSDEKNKYLTEELGFDAAINYKTTSNMRQALKAACPNGIDVYFDNVGGDITDAVLARINYKARIILCGQIALYNLDKQDVGPRVLTSLLIHSAMMKGFIVSDYAKRTREGLTQLGQWFAEGKLKYPEHIVEGFDHVPDAFLGLFRGDNLGKQLVKVADPVSETATAK